MYQFNLIPRQDMHSIIPFLQLLNPELELSLITERLEDMCTKGYECLGVYDEERLIGVCGIWVLTKIYVGRHIEPDNVCIHPDYRNKGIGEQMIAWVEDYGRKQGCIASELNAYVNNSKGHKFWMNCGYKVLGFHFQKQL